MISITEKIIENIMFAVNLKKGTSDSMLNPARTSRYAEPPKKYYKKYSSDIFTIDGRKCVTLKSSENPAKHIIYFHGGGYSAETDKSHWKFIDFLLNHIPAQATMVDYPLSPENTCKNCIVMVTEAYKKLSAKEDMEIILMGDSAGGGLALALAQNINHLNISPKPGKIILLSPWVDISMDDEMPEELAKSDPALDNDLLKTLGKNYAGDMDTKDFRCSPIYGNLADIADTALFIGTHDILFLQAVRLKEKMDVLPCKLSFYKYEGMIHDWMLFPLPGSSDAKKKIIEYINR